MYCKSKLVTIFKLVAVILVIVLIYPTGYFVLDHKKSINIKPVNIISRSVGAYIINLDRSQDRYQEVKPLVYSLDLPFERISAVDGYALSD